MSLVIRRVWTVWLWLVCVWPAAAHADAIDDALQNPQRREEDLDRDPRSKPKEVLSFFGVKPGMTVVDLFAGEEGLGQLSGRI